MNLKDYQHNAVDELCRKAKQLLRLDGTKRLVFKSPTGSGKTVMLAEFLKQLAKDSQVHPFACIWAAPRNLHMQSKDKLARHYADTRTLKCVVFDELSRREIGERQILFFNWESVRQEKNLIIRENEQDKYLDKVVENTREAGRTIILVVDESHYHDTRIANTLVEAIAPKLILNASATPELELLDEVVAVQFENVKSEGMVKKSVVINEGFSSESIGEIIKASPKMALDEVVLQEALNKRQQLADAFRALGCKINPLLCVQLPDRRVQQDDDTRNTVERFFAENGITVHNGKFAVYLADEKENLTNIADNDNEVEVLLFKHAIALGWDCPRAHILVLFRNLRSFTFSVQTLGRIMRMPEPNVGHYENEVLNRGYVYTNLEQMHIDKEMADGYLRTYTSQRIDEYAPLKLLSVHRIRQREKTRIVTRFSQLFLQAAQETNLEASIDVYDRNVSDTFIAEYERDNVDIMLREDVAGREQYDPTNEGELQKMFDFFVRENLTPYYPEDHSINSVKKAIYDFFGGALINPMDFIEDSTAIVKVVLSERNKAHFVATLDVAKKKYQAETATRKDPLQETDPWEIPEKITFDKKYSMYEAPSTKSVMQPFYMAEHRYRFGPEVDFIRFLEENTNVLWWYKNGEGVSMYFAVPYLARNDENPFYVDFIVRLADGRIGLYDTKKGWTIDEAKNKNDGLLGYIDKHNETRTDAIGKLTGGIVTKDGNVWKIYQGAGAALRGDNLSNWDVLDLTPPQ